MKCLTVANGSTQREKPVPVPLCVPQVPHRMAWDWTHASTVTDWRLTAWAMAQPYLLIFFFLNVTRSHPIRDPFCDSQISIFENRLVMFSTNKFWRQIHASMLHKLYISNFHSMLLLLGHITNEQNPKQKGGKVSCKWATVKQSLVVSQALTSWKYHQKSS